MTVIGDEDGGVCLVMTTVGTMRTMLCGDDDSGCDEEDGVW